MTVQFDTSGFVAHVPPDFMETTAWTWADLSPFVQGYVEALWTWADFERGGDPPGFSDFAPETLERILADCASAQKQSDRYGNLPTAKKGRALWEARQAGRYKTFPPQTPYLGDDGKVYLREAA